MSGFIICLLLWAGAWAVSFLPLQDRWRVIYRAIFWGILALDALYGFFAILLPIMQGRMYGAVESVNFIVFNAFFVPSASIVVRLVSFGGSLRLKETNSLPEEL